MKKIPGYIIILHVCHKWQSYDKWFLRFGAWKTGFLVILDHFLPLKPLPIQKNQNFEKWKTKKHQEKLSFCLCAQ